MQAQKWLTCAVLCCVCGLFGADRSAGPAAQISTDADAVAADVDRSPISVAVSPDRRYCVTANHTSNSVSLVDLRSGRVVTEHRCGKGPADVVWVDAQTLLGSLLHEDAVALLKLDINQLQTAALIPVGDEPRGLALTNGSLRRAFVAVSGLDQVAVIDLAARRVVERIPVGGIPKTLAVAPNGKWLVTCCSISGEVFVHELPSYKRLSRRTIFDDGFNLGRPVIFPNSTQVMLTTPINRTFPVSESNVEKGWVIDNRLSKLPLPVGKYWEQKQLGLDTRGRAAGDANALDMSPDEKWLVVSCGGSHELLVFDRTRLRWPAADPGDFIPFELLDDEAALRHVKLGGRPVDVRFVDHKTAVVANYLLNSLQVVDIAAAKVVRVISLGGPQTPSLARRGEAIFYDADLSFDSWFSCHSCHTDGHTSGQTFDTLNDGNYDTYKLVPSLRGVTHTGPWTWHGWQKSLPDSLKNSLRTTLSTPQEITDEDIEALVDFLATLEQPKSPHRTARGTLTPSAKRGRLLFENKAGCADCHQGKYKTAAETYIVGLESNRYIYHEFNPPSLRGVYSHRRFLHDGRADTLQEVLTQHHQPQNLTGEKLSANELRDLIAYLRCL